MREDKKKGTKQLAPACVPTTANISVSADIDNTTITQANDECQDELPGKRRKEHKCLAANAKVYSVAIKCYEEQMPHGWDAVKNAIRNVDSSKHIVIGICHDRDTISNGIWAVAAEKAHYHIIFKCVDRNKRVRVTNILDMLNIEFRMGVDDSLWMNRGIETVGNFTNYAVYLTHDTIDAMEDGKEQYSVNECVSNLTSNEIEAIRSSYKGFDKFVTKVTMDVLETIDKNAYNLGRSLGNFSEWYNTLSFGVRSSTKMKTIKESYDRGVFDRISEGKALTRLCIFIQGPPGIGKTYAAQAALTGKRVLSVNGGGTGKFDNLRPDHEAIVIDDETCPNLLNMTDNYICPVYRRNRNNPIWGGDCFVVTSNLNFREWAESCGIHTRDTRNYYGADVSRCPDSETYKALLSRFYICHVETDVNGCNVLILNRPSKRGTSVEQQLRLDMFKEFRNRFNAVIASYIPDSGTVDYDEILDEGKAIVQAKADKKRQEELQLQQQQLQQQKIIAQLMTQQRVEEPKQLKLPEPSKPPEPKQGGLWYVPFDADKDANVIHAGKLRYDAI